MNYLQVVLPECSDDAVSEAMRALTREIVKRQPDSQHFGLLGGDDGYGCDYENGVFLMFPFYWGGCVCGFEDREIQWEKENKHAADCYLEIVDSELVRDHGFRVSEYGYLYGPSDATINQKMEVEDKVRKKWCKRLGLSFPYGSAVHCTCGREERRRQWLSKNDHASDCPIIRPNFLHKRSGFEVNWYKYIGRGMEISNPNEAKISDVLAECLDSLDGQG